MGEVCTDAAHLAGVSSAAPPLPAHRLIVYQQHPGAHRAGGEPQRIREKRCRRLEETSPLDRVLTEVLACLSLAHGAVPAHRSRGVCLWRERCQISERAEHLTLTEASEIPAPARCFGAIWSTSHPMRRLLLSNSFCMEDTVFFAPGTSGHYTAFVFL